MESKLLYVISEIIRKTAAEKIIQNMQATCQMQDTHEFELKFAC